MINLIHEVRMNVTELDDKPVTREMLDRSIKDLYRKNKDKYQFILRGGKDLLNSLFALSGQVWLSEQKPEQWRKPPSINFTKEKVKRTNL